jgi:O-antigen biosynthesis protein
LFDKNFYLETHGDDLPAGMTALRHYVMRGDSQRRAPMAFFDPDYYRCRVRGRTRFVNTLLHYALVGRYRRISPSPWFDVDFYLAINKDVARAGFDPLYHFMRWGGLEGRSPSAEFDSAYYLRTNPDVAQLQLNPLLHYLQIGRFDGRSTLPDECGQTQVIQSKVCPASALDSALWSGLKSRAGSDCNDPVTTIDVVVPVFKGRARPCAVFTVCFRPPARPLLSSW